jgi:hypothetical protein
MIIEFDAPDSHFFKITPNNNNGNNIRYSLFKGKFPNGLTKNYTLMDLNKFTGHISSLSNTGTTSIDARYQNWPSRDYYIIITLA